VLLAPPPPALVAVTRGHIGRCDCDASSQLSCVAMLPAAAAAAAALSLVVHFAVLFAVPLTGAAPLARCAQSALGPARSQPTHRRARGPCGALAPPQSLHTRKVQLAAS